MRALSSRNTKPNAAGSPRPPRAASGARYDVLNRVGEGTLFVVYRVREKSSDRLLALKALKSNFNAHPQFAPALAQALADSAALSHPALARIEEVGREDGTLFQLQEWLPGQSLEARLRRAPFGRIETLSSTRQIAEALQFLHENGAIHGDLRPRQIISASDGQLKLTDYGLSQSFRAAGLSPADVLLDAVGYAAPELSVAAGRDAAPATPASDLYALGVILYRMLAGRAPFDGPSPIAVAMRHRNDAPLPPSRFNPNCAPDLEEIALRLLEKNPVARYASAAQLLQALNAATAQSTVFTAPQNHSENQSESVAKTVANQEDNKNSAPVESSTRLTNAPDESDAGSLSANSLLNAVDLFPATMLISDIASAPLSALNSATSAATAPVSTAPVATSPVSPTRTDDLLTEAERERKAIKKHRRREALGAFLAFFCIWIALGLLGGLVYGSYNWWVKQTPPDVVVPSYIGKNEDEARAALEKAGLKFNQVGEVYDLKRPAGTVIRGFPPAGKIVKPGRLIDVTVSRGAEKVVMPDLIEPGLDLIQARRILQAAGMRLGNIATTYNDTIARGYICGQFPQSGDSFSRSEPINLVISRGPQFAPAADKQNAKNSAQDGAQNADTQNSAQDGNTADNAIIPADGNPNGNQNVNPDGSDANGDAMQSPPPISSQAASDNAASSNTSNNALDNGGMNAGANGNDSDANGAPASSEIGPTVTRTVRLRISVPRRGGGTTREVRVVVRDAGGDHVVYDANHAPGELIEQDVQITRAQGKRATISIFIDGKLHKRQRA